MLDIGWSELLLIGVVALIVIGPEDLPKLFRTLGRLTARARGMAREFTSAMEDAAKSSGLEDATKALKDVNALTSKKNLGLDALDRAADRFEKWDPLNPKEQAKSKGPLPDPSAPVAPAPASSTSVPDQGGPELPPPPGISAPLREGELQPSPGQRRLHAVRRSDREQ